ncbi:mRNA-decapping enzyme-like protein isoform X3 [Arachis hypogaea]|uniref:mRNA-decapping enzyme-like protein isoform X3 n=1 Tax=Arachis hypogaea TaxID=3818 RepID=UPI003B2206B2
MHLIMNRQNTDNLVENLLDFEYELKKPYLLYRNAAQEVNGIWFYNEDECEEVANLFNSSFTSVTGLASKANIQLSSDSCSKFPFSL